MGPQRAPAAMSRENRAADTYDKDAQRVFSRQESERWAAARAVQHGGSLYAKPAADDECTWGDYYCKTE